MAIRLGYGAPNLKAGDEQPQRKLQEKAEDRSIFLLLRIDVRKLVHGSWRLNLQDDPPPGKLYCPGCGHIRPEYTPVVQVADVTPQYLNLFKKVRTDLDRLILVIGRD